MATSKGRGKSTTPRLRKAAAAAPAMPEPPAAGAVRKASRLLECSIAADKVAQLAHAQAETHLGIKQRRKDLAVYSGTQRAQIAADLRRLDSLADKVQHARFMGYVLCYETPMKDEKGNPMLRVRRADTDETWDEPLAVGAQLTIEADPPAAPPPSNGKGKAKGCTCPLEEHTEPRETWQCTEHGHMWRNPSGTIEPVPWNPREGEAPTDPVDALGSEPEAGAEA